MCQVAVMGLCLESCPSFDWGISPSCELAPYREQRHSLPLWAGQGVGRLRSTCQLVVCASVLLGRSTRREVRRGRSQKWSELCPFEDIADLLAESHGIQCLSLSQLIWVTTNQHSSWIYLASMGGSAQPVPLIVFQVLQFNTNCPECNAPAQTNMKLVRIFWAVGLLFSWLRHGHYIKEGSLPFRESQCFILCDEEEPLMKLHTLTLMKLHTLTSVCDLCRIFKYL